MSPPIPNPLLPKKRSNPFRSAVLRGMGVVVPPLITVLIFIWVGATVNEYVIRPVDAGLRDESSARGRHPHPAAIEGQSGPTLGESYHQLDDGTYVPTSVYDLRDCIATTRPTWRRVGA